MDWLCGPGEHYLLQCTELGNSLTRAESLMKEHEEFEIKTKVNDTNLFVLTFVLNKGECNAYFDWLTWLSLLLTFYEN